MADKVLTQAAYDTDNIQGEADQVKGQATALKITFDKTGNDAKTYTNTSLIAELQSQTLNDSGAHAIGLNTADTVATNVADELALIRQAGSGALPPDDSITLAKQNSTVKTGLLADLDTTDKTDLVSGINENVISRIAELDTGAADAYVVSTAGTFSRVEGNTFSFIPSNANTGASTINEDGNGIADIRKWVEGVSTALEEGDLPKFQKAELVWNSSETDFFFAPKSGAKEGLHTVDGNIVATAASLRADVSGKGVFKGVSNAAGAVYSFYYEVDGTRYPSTPGQFYQAPNFTVIPMNIPYKTSFKFYSQNTSLFCTYDLNGQFFSSTVGTISSLTTLRKTVSGAGRLTYVGGGNYVSLEIDGVFIFGDATNGRGAFGSASGTYVNFEYTTGFKYYGSEANWLVKYEVF